jgi:hypothetical protein
MSVFHNFKQNISFLHGQNILIVKMTLNMLRSYYVIGLSLSLVSSLSSVCRNNLLHVITLVLYERPVRTLKISIIVNG